MISPRASLQLLVRFERTLEFGLDEDPYAVSIIPGLTPNQQQRQVYRPLLPSLLPVPCHILLIGLGPLSHFQVPTTADRMPYQARHMIV